MTAGSQDQSLALADRSRAPEQRAPTSPLLLETAKLQVALSHGGGRVHAVKGLSYQLRAGQTLAIVGQSGSGKTVGCRALMGLLPDTSTVSGSVRFMGKELLTLTERELRRHRGADIAMVFQDGERALNPTMRIGDQITEAICAHDKIAARTARQRALELLNLLGLRAYRDWFQAYPHQLSGGMRQRVMVAIAIAGNPKVLIADEPTSSLDRISQMSLMEILMDLQQRFGMALMLVSHDLRLVGSVADDVLVMRDGQQVEYGPSRRLLDRPSTPYTKALFESAHWPEDRHRATIVALPPVAPSLRDVHELGGGSDRPRSAEAGAARLLEARGIVHEFASSSGRLVRAVSGVSFALGSSETLGLVGETGSGKSTLARALLLAPAPRSGSVLFRGTDVTQLRARDVFEYRRQVQMVFQDPFGSLNPKWRVSRIIEEPLVGFGIGDKRQRRRRVEEVLSFVGLPAGIAHRRPRQLSGGECQRVAIARALVPNPALIICDEALSSLDVITQGDLLTLFRQLRAQFGLAYLFISHDLGLVRQISDRVAVMYFGQLCEIGPAESLWRAPRHPYTAALLTATPGFVSKRPVMREPIVDGAGTDAAQALSEPPSGCLFRARCDRARERCALEQPQLRAIAGDHSVACHYPVAAGEPVATRAHAVGS
jgi:peptide/nickel transport system ATP-binding protein